MVEIITGVVIGILREEVDGAVIDVTVLTVVVALLEIGREMSTSARCRELLIRVDGGTIEGSPGFLIGGEVVASIVKGGGGCRSRLTSSPM